MTPAAIPTRPRRWQPFVNYNLSDGWYLTSAPIITADWEADRSADTWTVHGSAPPSFSVRRCTQLSSCSFSVFFPYRLRSIAEVASQQIETLGVP